MIKIILLLLILEISIFAQDFSQWRGPERDGKYPATNLLKSWPKDGPPLMWSFDELGKGHSSPAIAHDRIYITGMPEDQGVLYCFDMDGKLLWKTIYGPEWTKNYPGTRSAPAIKDSHLYIISGKGHLYCFDVFKGNELWSIDLLAKFNSQNIKWGMAESVIIFKDMVIATPGGSEASVVALNRYTGETVWTCEGNSDLSAYCSQQIIKHNGLDLIIAMTTESIMGIDANSGELYWRVKQTQDYHIHANTPVYHQGKIFCISGSNESTSGSVMLQLSKDGKSVTELWRKNDIENLMGGVVLHNGYIFGSRYEKQQWYCLDWKTGNLNYTSKELGKGAIVFADDLFYCYSEKGVLALVHADHHKFDIISSLKIRKGRGPHWSHPVILNGRLYLRHGSVLMVYDIGQK